MFHKFLNRREKFGEFQQLNSSRFDVSDFEFEPVVHDGQFNEDEKPFSIYVDGEAFIPERDFVLMS